MMAVWLAVDDAAIARCSNSGGTMPGTSVCMVGVSNARAVPLTNKMASITSRLRKPPSVPTAKAAAASALMIWQAPTTTRRS